MTPLMANITSNLKQFLAAVPLISRDCRQHGYNSCIKMWHIVTLLGQSKLALNVVARIVSRPVFADKGLVDGH